MSKNEKFHNNNAAMENNTAPIMKASSMKYAWHHTINNTVFYYQTSYNIRLILEQVRNCNNLLREQMSTEKASCAMQNNMIRDENMFLSKLHATENECTPNELDEKNKDKDSKVRIDYDWIF